ncbi:Hypothetical_protein [Hexamita inflata]|uniref:Hypothetical_protein n=1 Tax=Hexamita inflata TaxID=28002 RepID=A0AA86R355_9EUKA|nr:Hypothetical protein HINF_LOCUS52569 [Hexamita inflata]
MSCYFNDNFYIQHNDCIAVCSGLCIGSSWGYCCKHKDSLWWLGPLFGGLAAIIVIIIVSYRQFRKKQLLLKEKAAFQAQQQQIYAAMSLAVQQQSSIMLHDTKDQNINLQEQSNLNVTTNNNQLQQDSLNFNAVM